MHGGTSRLLPLCRIQTIQVNIPPPLAMSFQHTLSIPPTHLPHPELILLHPYTPYIFVSQHCSCLGRPLSAFPTIAPTYAPSTSGTIGAPKSSPPVIAPVSTPTPTYKTGNVPGASASVTVQVTQKLSGVDLATAQSAAFQTLFTTTVTTELSIAHCSIVE